MCQCTSSEASRARLGVKRAPPARGSGSRRSSSAAPAVPPPGCASRGSPAARAPPAPPRARTRPARRCGPRPACRTARRRRSPPFWVSTPIPSRRWLTLAVSNCCGCCYPLSTSSNRLVRWRYRRRKMQTAKRNAAPHPVRNQLCFSATGLQPVARRARFAQKVHANRPEMGHFCVGFSGSTKCRKLTD